MLSFSFRISSFSLSWAGVGCDLGMAVLDGDVIESKFSTDLGEGESRISVLPLVVDEVSSHVWDDGPAMETSLRVAEDMKLVLLLDGTDFWIEPSLGVAEDAELVLLPVLADFF